MRLFCISIFAFLLSCVSVSVSIAQSTTPSSPKADTTKHDNQEAYETIGRYLKGFAALFGSDLEEIKDTLKSAQGQIQDLHIQTDEEREKLIIESDTVDVKETFGKGMEILHTVKEMTFGEDEVMETSPEILPALVDQFMISLDFFSKLDLDNVNPDSVGKALEEAFEKGEASMNKYHPALRDSSSTKKQE